MPRTIARYIRPLLLASAACLVACAKDVPTLDGQAGSPRAANTATPETPNDTTLFDSLRAIERRTGGRLGFAAIHIESGWKSIYRGEETFPMASVAKLPMALLFMRELDAGRFRLDSSVHLSADDHKPGASRLYHRIRREQVDPTIHELVQAMLIESDNTASDVILRLAGGPVAANTMMRDLGFSSIDITSYEGDLILRWAGIDPSSNDTAWTRERIYAGIETAGKEKWEDAQASLVNDPRDATKPEEMARLLAILQQGLVLSPTSTDTVLAIMSRAVTGKGRIPALLPPGTPVAHKTGTIGSVANDVGIVSLPNGRGHLALALLLKDARVTVRKRDRAIAEASSLVYRWFLSR